MGGTELSTRSELQQLLLFLSYPMKQIRVQIAVSAMQVRMLEELRKRAEERKKKMEELP